MTKLTELQESTVVRARKALDASMNTSGDFSRAEALGSLQAHVSELLHVVDQITGDNQE